MINLPYVTLPDYFTGLLSSDGFNSQQGNLALESYINKNPGMSALIKRICRDVDAEGFLGKIIAQLGWVGIRNRLACAFLERMKIDKFPDVVNLNLINDLIELENQLRDYTAGNSHRAFMLGFYAKMSSLSLRNLKDKEEYTPLVIHKRVLDLLEHSHSKSKRIDWLIFELIHFDYFLGNKRMNSLIEKKTDYEHLYALLSDEEKDQFLKNILTYAASIGDEDIFIKDISGE